MVWTKEGRAARLARRGFAVLASAALAFGPVPAVALAGQVPSLSVEAVAKAKIGLRIVGPDAEGGFEVYAQRAGYEVSTSANPGELVEQLLVDAGLEHESSVTEWGYYLSSITSPSTGEKLEYDGTNYWSLYVNGDYSMVGIDSVELADGVEITFAYGATPAEADAASSSARAAALNSPGKAGKLAWAADLKEGFDAAGDGMMYANVSDRVIAGGKLYQVVNDQLQRRSLATGKIEAKVQLAQGVDYASRPVAAEGKIVVPEAGGAVEAFDLATLERAWATPVLADGQQNSSYLSVSGGRVFGSTFEWGPDGKAANGYVYGIDLATGAEWTYRNATSGYYWAGFGIVGGYGVIADDAGDVQSFDLSQGKPVSSAKLESGSRAGVVADASKGKAYVVTVDGSLTELAVSDKGALAVGKSVKFADSAVARPTLYKGLIYAAGGTSSESGSTGIVAAISQDDLSVKASVSASTGGALPSRVDSEPVISAGAKGYDVYFTANALPGAVYGWHVNGAAHAATAQDVYVPAAAKQNYCMSNVALDASGNLYYSNDSATLFKVQNATFAWKRGPDKLWYVYDGRGTAIAPGWFEQKGSWSIAGENGKALYGWQSWGNDWYWFGGKEQCYMLTGWQTIGGARYYLQPNGKSSTGWKQIGGAWYCFAKDGKMLKNQRVGAYWLGADGKSRAIA